MILEQIYTHNEFRNYNYLLICSETGECLAIDPFAADTCIAYAKQHGVTITKILNTHEHWDHIGGNAHIVADSNAKIYAHINGQATIPSIDIVLQAGDRISVGHTIEIEILDTPGHTMAHVCALVHDEDHTMLFSGDTLFQAGCGNCRHGGDVHALFHTFNQQLIHLADETRIYPGHDYIKNNLAFALAREPNNHAISTLVQQLDNYCPSEGPFVTTLGQEKAINPFFRCHETTIIEQLRQDIPQFTKQSLSDEEVFVALRRLRDHW